ncbi:hypothetical protein [uncultured Devosia sp.]|uniref:hypothetical protein n=1 Tax=uncultured Devosia sp. TaxID=211434 RepID=UPI0026025CCE|nr:hypothetical protein [uncultured Devosia sp.]
MTGMENNAADQMWLDELVDVATTYYETTDAPLLMSKFGQTHRELRAELVQRFGSLSNAVRAVGNRLEVIKISGLVGQEAIAPVDRVKRVTEELAQRSTGRQLAASSFLRLPFPLRVAFCVKTEQGEKVAVSTEPPYRYLKLEPEQAIPFGMVLLDEKYRHPGLRLENASDGELQALWANYSLWANEVNFAPSGSPTQSTHQANALTRLMGAQDEAMKSKIKIPLDIIEILLKHP